MVNNQHRQQPVWSARQPVYGHQSYHQLRKLYRQRRLRRLRRLIGPSLLLVLVLLFVVWGVVIRAQKPAPGTHVMYHPLNPALAAQVDKLLASQVAGDQFSGSVLIASDGRVLFSKGYSMADWDDQLPNTPHTKFHIGSLTKQFTAMATLILQERGKLHVQDSLCTYVAKCPVAWQPVTLHQLLTHTSGIPQLDSPVPLSSPQDWIARYNNVPLAFSAGVQFSYCNVCYQILGYVIEQVSGEPYATFLQQALFDPLHMMNSGFDSDYLSLPNHAVGYTNWQVKADPDGWDVPPQMSFLLASGLLYTTAEDLYRWDQALWTHALVSQRSLNAMFTPYVSSCPTDGPEASCPQYSSLAYGYGWFIAKGFATGHQLVWHYGALDGFTAYIARYPDHQVSMIILSNLGSLDEFGLASALEKIIFAKT